ncbi:MAG TPA: acyl-CoA thioesterase [Candidatus Caccomorpha excrementavium]|nr:acyl-CoA thioesterase [Candidatus Caccomorpha excrementavium]
MEEADRLLRTVEYSRTEQIQIVMPEFINGTGRLFGGKLVEWIDIVAAVVARRHSGMDVTTACIDQLIFKRGAFVNDMLVLIGRITYVGTTSMEIRVDTYVEEPDGVRKPINRAYLVTVALDKEGKSARVPGLLLQTETERAEWEGGIRRMKLRKERRAEGY